MAEMMSRRDQWMRKHRHAAPLWLLSSLAIVAAVAPAPAAAQRPRPAAFNQPMKEAELAQGCAVAEAAWPELAAALKPDHKPRIVFVSKTPVRYFFIEDAAVEGREAWKEYLAWKYAWRREIPDSRPPPQALFQRWRRTAESGVFACPGFAAARSIETVPTVPRSPAIGVRLDDIYVLVAVPIVAKDGQTALVYSQFNEGIGHLGIVTHLAKVKGEWRVVGQRRIDAPMA
jgi:hypothetical protein